MLIDGKLVSHAWRQKIKESAEKLFQSTGAKPGLGVILVGEDPASSVYVGAKIKACQEVGFLSVEIKLPQSTTKEELKKEVLKLNERSDIHGILVQLPLPKHMSSDEVISWISPQKDVDGLTDSSMGKLIANLPGPVSCTPKGVMKLLEHYNFTVEGLNCVVIGRSLIVGKPMAQLLTNANATVTLCHSKTRDLKFYTHNADLVVVAAGLPKYFGKEYFKKDSIVIDVGIHRIPLDTGKAQLCGDVKFDELKDWCRAITPVPGGVGPMTIAMLLDNTLLAFQSQMNIK